MSISIEVDFILFGEGNICMLCQKNWLSIEEIFDALNKENANYLVMRNYECFASGEVFLNSHDDIDLLCDNINQIKRILDTRKRFWIPTINSYYIKFNNLKVNVDIRFIGDGYYDENWQKEMLKNKRIVQSQVYVMAKEDYFYSLIYHAIFQKYYLSDEYLQKLKNMSREFGFEYETEADLLSALIQYMKDRNYEMTITRDPAIILNAKAGFQANNIKKHYFWLLKRRIYEGLKRMKGDKIV